MSAYIGQNLYTSPLTQDEIRKVLDALREGKAWADDFTPDDVFLKMNSAIAILKGKME